jgi:alpha-galactosidase
MKVTIIGGGSYQWGPKLIADLLTTPSLAGVDLVLEDIDHSAAQTMAAYGRLVDEKVGAKATISATTDQRSALEGSDYVVVTISTGGFASMAVDLEVPARHGIEQSVGDTVGPGGINRALRNIPVLLGIARDMEECCPEAWMLNITNPMTCLTRAVCKESSLKCVGLCHEVGNFCMDVAIALGLPHLAVRPKITGINHFPVVCSLDIDGEDGFAVLSKLVEELGGLEAVAAGEEAEPFSTLDFARRHLVSLTFLDRFGALPAAGDRHVAEFVPWILTESSGWGASWGIELTSISRREEHQEGYIADVNAVLSGTNEPELWQSGEMVAPVIDSITTGAARELPLNLPNTGQCPDLPLDAVVETMCVVDGEGIRGRDRARPPEALSEILRREVAVQELTVQAALSGDRGLARAAFLLDPLAGRGALPDIEAMADELLEGTSKWLPQFNADARAVS